MTPQSSELIRTGPVPTSPSAVTAARPGSSAFRGPRAPVGLLLLGLGVLVVTGLLIAQAVVMALAPRPQEQKKIAVPYAGNKGLWQPWHRVVVQADGRNKPFESYAIDMVRTITGREHPDAFPPKTDPVAVVVSWIMLYDPDRKVEQEAGKAIGCDWESEAFILCDDPLVREQLYAEYRSVEPSELTEVERHGKYVEPAVLRHSGKLKELIRSGMSKQRLGEKGRVTTQESNAQEVWRRLTIWDRARSGSDFETGHAMEHGTGEWNLVGLDPSSRTWFSIKSLRYLTDPRSVAPRTETADGKAAWEAVLHKRSIDDADAYEGKAPQPYPAEQIREVLAAFDNAREAYRANDADRFAAASTELLDTSGRVTAELSRPPDTAKAELELAYNRYNLFHWAWIVSLGAAFLLGGSVFFGMRWKMLSRGLYMGGLAFYLAAMTCFTVGFVYRCLIAGRPPVGNMYESIIWVAAMTAVFGLILELVYRRGVIALAAALVSTVGFLVADQLPLTFPPSITPLNAVLRSNLWLTVHVLTIVGSYAPLALAWGLGNFNIGLILFAPQRKELIKTLSMFSYRAIQIGVLLLFAGTMLGGVWAAQSWGRFWGWDPKEVWALIAFLTYMIPLHARYIGWVKDFGLAACSVVCFSSVVMAWYGVNFVLGAGLHSYGFGSGSNEGLNLALLLNLDLVLLAAIRYKYRGAVTSLFHRSELAAPTV
jgi:ABC-type transport system involved in cytochrome c biogenesis permease subunit